MAAEPENAMFIVASRSGLVPAVAQSIGSAFPPSIFSWFAARRVKRHSQVNPKTVKHPGPVTAAQLSSCPMKDLELLLRIASHDTHTLSLSLPLNEVLARLPATCYVPIWGPCPSQLPPSGQPQPT